MKKPTFNLVKKIGFVLALFISLHFLTASIYADVPEIAEHPKDYLELSGKVFMYVQMKNHATTYMLYQYEWRKNGITIPGENDYDIELNVDESDHGAEIDVIVSNAEGSVTSEKAVVLICSQPPIFKSNLETENVVLNDDVKLSVDIYGESWYSLQWYHNGLEIPNQKGSTYHIKDAQLEDGGEYYLAIDARGHLYASNNVELIVGEPKFLFIVASSLQTDSDFMNLLDQYRNVAETDGWVYGTLYVDKNTYPSEKELKAEIQDKYTDGYRGFVMIGSDDEIPTAYWRVTKIATDDRTGETFTPDPIPTDLYYADIDEWGDIDNDGIYESYHVKQDSAGKWVADKSNPVNSDNSPFIPEFIFGRITPKKLDSDNSGSEIEMIKKYLTKILNARTNGGSLLPQEEMKNRGLVFLDESYNDTNSQIKNIREATNNIKRISDITLTNADVLADEVTRGYRFIQQMIHSAHDAHWITEWYDGKETGTYKYNLNVVKNSNVMVDYINMFSCSAAKFDVPNFGSTYLFYTDYTLNVTGSTAEWGPTLDQEYYEEIAQGLPLGKVVKNYIVRQKNDLSIPKMILHGDPLFTYAKDISNKAPLITNDYNNGGLCYVEAHIGEQLTINFSADDPDENETLDMNMDGFPMPEQSAFFNPANNTFSWTPSAEFENTTHNFRINAIDKAGNISTEDFTIYVALLDDGDAWEFENEQSGIVTKSITKADSPFEKYSYKIEANNSWGAFKQEVDVKTNKLYKLSFYYNSETDESVKAFSKIPELEHNINLSVEKTKEYKYSSTVFYTDDISNITIKLYLGDENNPETGQITYHGVELRYFGEPQTGDVNCDGHIGISDWQAIYLHLTDVTTLTQTQKNFADVNSDNFISYHDLELIDKYLNNEIDSLPYECAVGDIDKNGIIDQADSDLAAQYYIQLVTLTPEQVIMANVNNGDPDDPLNNYDKEVNILDALAISQYVNGIITELPFFKR